MRVIGVIDLKHGVAVHARAGQRQAYSAVTAAAGHDVGGDPVALARIYTERLRIAEIYVADLDAIGGAPPQDESVRRIAASGARVIVDGAVATEIDLTRVISAGAQAAVVGLETLASFEDLGRISALIPRGTVVFSLDLKEGEPFANRLGLPPRDVEEIARRAVGAGVNEIIVLDLARVGMRQGPDLGVMRRVRCAVPDATLLAGGGVRGLDDLRRLSALGCDGALVATALHDGRLTAMDVVAACHL